MGLEHVYDALTASSTTQKYALGERRPEDDGNVYEYVKNHASGAAIAAGSVCYRSTTITTVATDVTNGLSQMPAGVGVGAIAPASYGWILVEGVYASVLKTNSIGNSTGALLVSNLDSTGLAGLLSSSAVFGSTNVRAFGVALEATGSTSTQINARIKGL